KGMAVADRHTPRMRATPPASSQGETSQRPDTGRHTFTRPRAYGDAKPGTGITTPPQEHHKEGTGDMATRTRRDRRQLDRAGIATLTGVSTATVDHWH
ncbi:MAG: hypothetical protein ACRDSL_20680, partial [Pseudonocardiaceae bacterium]